MKRYLFVLRSAAYSGVIGQENLDLVLTASAFEQKVSLLFLDDGIFQILRGQQPSLVVSKVVSTLFLALGVYDVDEIYVEVESLRERGVTGSDLVLPVSLLTREDVKTFLCDFDRVIVEHN